MGEATGANAGAIQLLHWHDEWRGEILRRLMIELMTIGYEGLTVAGFLDLLRRCRVSRLVDVRELPISRKPGFAKAALSAAIEARGIRYEHLVALGCPREIRHRYREDGDKV